MGFDQAAADEIDGQDITPGSVETGATRTETIGAGEYRYAGDYDGADAEARLNNALSAAADGDTIQLENAVYTDAVTTSKTLRLNSTGGGVGGGGSEIDAQWTFNGRVYIDGLRLGGSGEIVFNAKFSSVYTRVSNGNATGVTVNANECRVSSFNHDVVFESGTSGGLVDFSVDVTVTDNGSNTIGDVS